MRIENSSLPDDSVFPSYQVHLNPYERLAVYKGALLDDFYREHGEGLTSLEDEGVPTDESLPEDAGSSLGMLSAEQYKALVSGERPDYGCAFDADDIGAYEVLLAAARTAHRSRRNPLWRLDFSRAVHGLNLESDATRDDLKRLGGIVDGLVLAGVLPADVLIIDAQN